MFTMWNLFLSLPVNVIGGVISNLELCDIRNLDSSALVHYGRQELLAGFGQLPPYDLGKWLPLRRKDVAKISRWAFGRNIRLENVPVDYDSKLLSVLTEFSSTVLSIKLRGGSELVSLTQIDSLSTKVVELDLIRSPHKNGSERIMSPSALPNLRKFSSERSGYDTVWYTEFLSCHPEISELGFVGDAIYLTDELAPVLQAAESLRNVTIKLPDNAPGRCLRVLTVCGPRLRSLTLTLQEHHLSPLMDLVRQFPVLEDLNISLRESTAVLPAELVLEFVRHCPRLHSLPRCIRLDDALLAAIGRAGLHLTTLALVDPGAWVVESVSVVEGAAEALSTVQQLAIENPTVFSTYQQLVVRHTVPNADRHAATLVRALQCMPQLHTLNMPMTDTLDAAAPRSVPFVRLRELHLLGITRSAKLAWAILKVNPLLEAFSCTAAAGLHFTFRDLQERCPRLRSLRVYEGTTVVEAKALADVAKGCPRLRHVDVPGDESDREFDVAVLALAENCRGLESLALGRATPSEGAILRLCDACPRLTALTCATKLSPEAKARLQSTSGQKRVAYKCVAT